MVAVAKFSVSSVMSCCCRIFFYNLLSKCILDNYSRLKKIVDFVAILGSFWKVQPLNRYLPNFSLNHVLKYIQDHEKIHYLMHSYFDHFPVNVYFRPLILPRVTTRLNMVTLLNYYLQYGTSYPESS